MHSNRLISCFALILCSISSIFAQTGPGGVGNATGSGGQPRNVLWLRADAGVTQAAGRVSNWADQSGNGLNASQATGTAQPLWTNSNVNLNNRASINFASGGGFSNVLLAIPDNDILDDGTGFSFFVAMRSATGGGPMGILNKRTAADVNQSYRIYKDGTNLISNMSTNANGVVTIGGFSDNTNHLYSGIYDGSLSGNKYTAYRSSVNAGSTAGPAVIPNNASPVYIGNFNLSDNRSFSGDIAEVVIYKNALTAPERLVVENYLSQKYSIGIGANDLFGNDAMYSSTFVENLTGIGSVDGTVKRTEGVSESFQLREADNSLNSNEFIFFAHDGTAHASGVLTNLGEPEITSRWARSWYLESTFNGSVDAGSIAANLVFDFATAGLPFTGNAGDYVLIYRDNATGNFSRVVATSYAVEAGTRLVVSVSANRLETGYYTIALGTQLTANTWYVFQDGNWSDPNTWTLDASVTPIYNNPGSAIPGPDDDVLIRAGRSVTIQPVTNNITINSIEVRGTLNLTNSTGHNFNRIDGNGIIRMAGFNPGSGLIDNFPSGNVESNIGFADQTNGGTVVIDGAANITLNVNRNWRNIRIERTSNTDEVYLGADYLVRGDFTVRNGTFYFGDNSATTRSLTVEGNVLVEDNGSTRIGRIRTRSVASAVHNFDLKGNLTNNGQIYFTNRADFGSDAARYNPANAYYTTDDNTGRVNVSFTGNTTNQTLALNNIGFFSRIVVDKGGSSTYILDLQATDSANFRLLGRANYNIDSDITAPASNLNAFALVSGTARLNSNVIIPVLNTVTNYSIPSAARLWINGGYVRKTSGTAIVPYGAVEVSAGQLISTVGSGITLRGSGSLKVSGGTVTLRAFRTSVQGASAQGTYEQSGGSVIILGGAGISADYAVFSLTYTGNVFIMSGGTLRIQGRTSLGTGNLRGTVFINADVSNQSVTGGTVIFESNTTTEYRITSRAPFYNVRMRATVASAGEVVLDGTSSGTGAFPDTQNLSAQPLRVLNDLILEGNDVYPQPQSVVFRPVTSGANVNDVYVGGTFFVDRTASYIPVFGGVAPYDGVADQPTAVNTTYFNQTIGTSAIDTLYFGSNGQFELGAFVLDRTSGNELRTIGRFNRGDASIMIDVNGDASVLSGTLDQNRFTFRIWASIVNNDRMGTYFNAGPYPTASGTPSLAQVRFREDPPLTISTTAGSVFGNIRFNVGAATTIELTSDVQIERMEYLNGRIYARNFTLTVDEIWNWNNGGGAFFDNNVAASSLLRVTNTGFIANICVFTDGKASDGGLRVRVSGNTIAEDATSRINNTGPMTFPVGFTLDGGTTVYYRPAQIKVKNFADDGYVQIRAVSGELTTTDISGGEILRHYWRVTHDGFGAVPTVALRLYYRNRTDGNIVDLQTGNTQQASYVPGYVIDNLPYTRYFESDPVADITDLQDGPNASTRHIVFNGTSSGAEFTQAGFVGFTLANGNYTAGESTRFVGAPTVYYTRLSNGSDWYNRFWEDGNNWSTVPHDGAANNAARPAAGTWPQAGDIAVIGYGGFTGGISPTHSINIADGNTIQVAEIIYENPLGNGSRLVVNRTSTLTFGKIGGTGGTFMERPNSPAEAATITGDFGDFYSSNTFTYSYFLNGNGTYTINPPTTVFPNLRIEGGNNSRIAIFNDDIQVNNNLTVDGNTILRTGTGNFVVTQECRIGGYLGGTLQFGTNTAVTFETGGLRLRGSADNANVQVLNTTPNALNHRLIVNGNIIQERPGVLDLFNGNGVSDNNAILELRGTGVHNYAWTAGTAPELYRLLVSKGSDTSSSFSFDFPFTLNGPTNQANKAVEIRNGLLILNDPSIDITLSSGGGNFLLPNLADPEASSGSGGFVLTRGVARIIGANTGMILDGLLRINGGELNMDGGAGVNNFIEYSASGNAVIELSSGNLIVGSQLRRSLVSTSGVLKYRQTGGRALFAKNAAPNTPRGAFEVINSGSEFTFTGGEFVIERHINSPTRPTLLLEPDNFTVGGRAIEFGNTTTPVNQNNFNIRSSILIDSLVLASANVSSKIIGLPLSVNHLVITNGASFDPDLYAFTVNNSISNNGTFSVTGLTQTTFFPSSATTTLSGTGTTTFRNVDKAGTGTLLLEKNITATNDVSITGGVINTQSFAFNIGKDLTFNTTHLSDVVGNGIVFNGSQKQKLQRTAPGTSFFSTVRLNNTEGLVIEATDLNFQVNQRLVLESGVFDIGGNLLTFTPTAVIENGLGNSSKDDFNVTRMIQTNSSINDFGVRKSFNAVSSGNVTFTFPVGLIAYTPVVATVNDINASSITVRPVADIPPVPEDSESALPCSDPEITDASNVLQYYWIIKSNGTTGFNGELEMFYDPATFNVTAPYTVANYGPARLYNAGNTWDKVFTQGQFDEANQRIEFPFTGNGDATISGIYTAGVTLENDGTTLLCGAAIPDVVPEFITLEAVATGNFYADPSYQGGVAPLVGSTPDITVKSGFTLTLNVNSIRTRKITIESGATLEVNGTIGHNLGFVTGEGTLKLVSNTSSVSFPAGDYEDFFPTAACSGGGGLEYAGSGSYSILSGLSNVRRLILSGSGDRVFSNNTNVRICEDLEIIGSVDAIVPDGNSIITVLGNVYKSDLATFDNGGGNSKIALEGTSQQLISGSFVGTNAFNELEVDNTVGLTIINNADASRGIAAGGDVDIQKSLLFSNGIITTDATNQLRLLNLATADNYSSTRYVNGPLIRQLAPVVQSFPFPVGTSTRYGLMEIASPASYAGVKNFTVQYFNSIPPNDVFNLTAAATTAGVDKASGNEYWNVDAVSPASSRVRLYWDALSDVQSTISNLRILFWNGAAWDLLPTVTAPSGTVTSGSMVSGPLTYSNRDITFGTLNATATPLPVELTDFTGKRVQGVHHLMWITRSELNNDYFEIQRSLDGESFVTIGRREGRGTTNETTDYTFVDEMPLLGNNYYRLKQVDFDGTTSYSWVVVVNNPDGRGQFNMWFYPNPVRSGSELNVKLAKDNADAALLVIHDLLGREIYSSIVRTTTFEEVKVILPEVVPGVYLVEFRQGLRKVVKRLVVN